MENSDDKVVDVHEGARSTTNETYWEIVYVVDAESLDGVYFGDFTAENLSAFGIQDVYEMASYLGELKISEQ